MYKHHNFTRREFLKNTVGAFALGSASFSVFGIPKVFATESKNAAEDIPLEYRVMGDTGMKYTALGFGAMRTTNSAIIRRAVDMGVNNIDTARGYMGGQNEEIVGKAIGDIRDKVHISTKIKVSDQDRMIRDAEASLKALGTDYVDILLAHGLSSVSDLNNEVTRTVLEKLKKDGKARFIGFSTHRNMDTLLNAAAEDKFYDVVLAAYNFKHDESVTRAVNNAAKAGIGVMAMKTQAGGYEDSGMGNLSPHQAALRWVLSNKSVTNTIPSMVTFDQVDENIQVMDTKLGWFDRKTLYQYGNIIDKELCRFCDLCDGQCPSGVSVPDVNRCVMYADGYRDMALAQANYLEIPTSQNANPCRDCDLCEIECVNGLNIAGKMGRAVELFT